MELFVLRILYYEDETTLGYDTDFSFLNESGSEGMLAGLQEPAKDVGRNYYSLLLIVGVIVFLVAFHIVAYKFLLGRSQTKSEAKDFIVKLVICEIIFFAATKLVANFIQIFVDFWGI